MTLRDTFLGQAERLKKIYVLGTVPRGRDQLNERGLKLVLACRRAKLQDAKDVS